MVRNGVTRYRMLRRRVGCASAPHHPDPAHHHARLVTGPLPEYPRHRIPGGRYFFTLAPADQRRDLLLCEISAPRAAVARGDSPAGRTQQDETAGSSA